MIGLGKTEVLVVGAGPVGLFAALRLAKEGVRVQIVDRAWRPGAHSYALALHAGSLELLDEFGLREALIERAYPVRTVALYDAAGERRAEMHLPGGGDRGFVAVMRQDVLERLFEDALRRAGVKVQWNHEVARLIEHDDHVAATINTLEKDAVGYAVAHSEWVVARSNDLSASWVIGADGHHSFVRRLLGIDFTEVGPAQQFAVFEFRTDVDLGHEMRLALADDTADVLWPLPEGYCRFSFELPDAPGPGPARTKSRVPVEIGTGQYPVLSEESFRAMLRKRAPWFDGHVREIRWRIVVRFERRLADSFGRDRMWLAGDAGHLTGPAGMQSMNVGLREADELARRLAAVLRDGAPAEQLQEYNEQRRDEWRFLLSVGDEAGPHGLAAAERTDPWIAENAARLLPCIPAAGDELAALVEQIGLRSE